MSSVFATYPSLEGRHVLITGGASGIGAEIVRQFMAQASKISFLDKNVSAGEALSAELGDECHFTEVDLTQIDQLKAAIARLIDERGPVDVLVNNAAHDDRHNWREVTEDYFNDRIAVNIRHQFFAIQAVAPGMVEQGKGSIINVGSNSWWENGGGFPVYATAKSAVHGLTRTMARDLGHHGIRVNTVVPGWVMTERQKELWVTEDALNAQLQRQCLHKELEPVYIARMIVFLASDDAAMCSSSNFMVDAGSI